MYNPEIKADASEVIEKQRLLLEISRLYNKEFRQTWETITAKAAKALRADRTSIWSLSQSGAKLNCEDLFISKSGTHETGHELEASLVPAYFNALEGSRFIDASDGENDPRTSEFTHNYLNPLNIKSLLDVPIHQEGKLSGVLCFEYTGAIRTWSLEEKDFAASLADLVSAKFEALERSRAEEELIVSEQRYRNILDHALIGIFRNTLDGTIVYANAAMVSILEFDSLEEMLQAKAFDFYPVKEERDEMVRQIMENKYLRNLNLTLITRKGNPRHCIINSFLEKDHIVGMIMDVTNQRKILTELEDARIKAEESDRLKTSLLANMSHELRTPMNSILGFSELLLHGSTDPDTIFYSQKIHGSGKRLMNTLQAILELADMETTRSKIVLKEVGILSVLSPVLSPFQSLASEKGLYLVTELDTSLAIFGDENLLKLVFQNLLDNAIKFTESGGVTIESSLENRDGTNWVKIRFSDTGIGIDPAMFDQIFQEFRQASEGYNRRYEGTGLGLTLSKKMLQLMGGMITLESEPGLGSTFTVWMPSASDQNRRSEEPKKKADEPGKPIEQPSGSKHPVPRILVVEDNEDNAEIVRLFLKSTYLIDRAPDGHSAIKMAETSRYEAILLDINLGIGMDGLKIVSELRQHLDYRLTPIIAITGYTMGEDRKKIMDAGCSHYIAKPFTKSVLLDVLNTALLKR